jgi:H+/Cl- antiporter ClcA
MGNDEMFRAVKFTYLLALYITFLFCGGMMLTFFNDWLQSTGFFGDELCKHKHIGGYGVVGAIDDEYHWGARHYWYWWLCFILFILSCIRIFIWAVYYWEPENKTI